MLGLDKDLRSKVEKNVSLFVKIIKTYLKAKNENVLIITDYGMLNYQLAPMLAYGFYLAAQKRKLTAILQFQEMKKEFMYADDNIQESINRLDKGSIIIVCTSNELGKIKECVNFTSFCKEKEHRYMIMNGLMDAKTTSFDMFTEALNVNNSRINKQALLIKKKLDKTKEMKIKTEKGTDLVMSIDGKSAVINAGIFNVKGTGGNLPIGDISIPVRGQYNVNGKVVVDGTIITEYGGFMLDEPIIIYIEDGKIIGMEGRNSQILKSYFSRYENRSQTPYKITLISRIGFGLNTKALMIGSLPMDKRSFGAAFIGFGDNSFLDGDIESIFKGISIFKNPEVYLDGERLKF